MKRSNRAGVIILSIVTAFTTALAILIALNHQFARDFVRSLSFQPTAEVANIEESLNLTSSGSLIFRATNPQLESSNTFNKHCSSYNPGVSVLGCYTNNGIYVYDIKNQDLQGIIESTAAHELMHAIWERLPESDRSAAEPLLAEVYAKHPSVFWVIEDYAEDSRTDELFARVGTEVAEIPATLEEIYARYFNDRAAIVAFYDNYHTVFEQLSSNITGLASRIEELKASIDAKTADYIARSATLTEDVAAFNECAGRPDCYSLSEFADSHARLSAEQDALNALYHEIVDETTEYNQKVSEYNQNALRIDYYTNIVNSNLNQEE